VTVTAVNDAPTLAPIGPATILEDAGPQTVNLTGIGAGLNEAQTLTVTATRATRADPRPGGQLHQSQRRRNFELHSGGQHRARRSSRSRSGTMAVRPTAVSIRSRAASP
jgi:hypothetical protein